MTPVLAAKCKTKDCSRPADCKGLCIKCYQHEWYAARQNEFRAKNRARYAANREKYREKVRLYREANPETIRARKHAAYRSDPKKVIAAVAAWRKANPEKKRAQDRKYRRVHSAEISNKQRVWRKAHIDEIRVRGQVWRAAARSRGYYRAYRAARPELKMYKREWNRRRPELRSVHSHYQLIFGTASRPPARCYIGMPFFDGWNPTKGGSKVAGEKWIIENIGPRPDRNYQLHIIDRRVGFMPGNLVWVPRDKHKQEELINKALLEKQQALIKLQQREHELLEGERLINMGQITIRKSGRITDCTVSAVRQ